MFMGWGRFQALLRFSLAGAFFLVASPASAHVKWFAPFDVTRSPKSLDYLFSADFVALTMLALLVLVLGSLLEESLLGAPVTRAIDRATAWIRADADRLVRAVCAFFFIALWTLGGTILTPELRTTVAWIPWLQFAMAIALIWRKTTPLAALGIVFLFGYGMSQYGLFHVADYPIFLGVAVYLTLIGLQRDLFGIRPVDVLRWTAGVTLMWASVEKWAYPEWSYPLLIEHPTLTMGYEGAFFMLAAGVIEFALAFALLWTPLVRRCAAIVLAGMFIGACFEFGKLDVIGHAPIIIVLLVLASDDARVQITRKHLVLAPAGYAAALVLFLTLYYGSHAALFGSLIPLWAHSPPAQL
jgi:hypothetical protein